MKGTYLGEFEEVVLLAVAVQHQDAYGASIVGELEKQLKRSVNLGAVHSALSRLEEKGLVNSVLEKMQGDLEELFRERREIAGEKEAAGRYIRDVIGIRKVLGSGELSIVRLLSGEFMQMILVAIVIALPLSYLVVENWLENFAYAIQLE